MSLLPHHSRRMAAIAAAGFVALTMAGCGSSGSSSPSTAPSGGPSSAPSASAAGGSGGTVLFPITVGETWIYNDVLAGGVHGVVTDKVLADVPVAGGHDVTISHVGVLPGLPKTSVTQTFVFHDDGSITVPFTAIGSGSTKETLKSGNILWPSAGDIASGRPHTSPIVISITTAGHTMTVHATVIVQGMGTRSVTVPAGTYNATLIKEEIEESVGGFHVKVTVETWLAPGVGPVRTQATTSTGTGPLAVQELKSYTK